MQPLSTEQRNHWHTHGWLAITGLLNDHVRSALPNWVNEVSQPVTGPQQRLHYYEQGEGSRLLCRTERFIEDHADLAALLTTGAIVDVAGQLMGEPARLYKEKINYKAPGGAGFAPHQDATAYDFVTRNVTCLIAVDAMTLDNGCLEFSSHSDWTLLPQDSDGCLDRDYALSLTWVPATLQPGDMVFFTSFVPHRSGPNLSFHPRRALYITYSAAAEGDLRAKYYQERQQRIAAAKSDGKVRISTIGHFQGKNVTSS